MNPHARPQPRRRFGRLDAAVLLAATALGVFLARQMFRDMTQTVFDEGRHNPRGFQLWRLAATPLFASWTLALLPLYLRRPGPRPGLLVRRPGFAAALVVALTAVRAGIEQAAWMISSHWRNGPLLPTFGLLEVCAAFPGWFGSVADPAGFVLASAWFALTWGRWWRPEPSWVDRAGRGLGWFWIAMFAASCYERAAG